MLTRCATRSQNAFQGQNHHLTRFFSFLFFFFFFCFLRLAVQRLRIGMVLVGVVKEIHDLDMIVCLPGGLSGTLAITEISDVITAAVKKAAASASTSGDDDNDDGDDNEHAADGNEAAPQVTKTAKTGKSKSAKGASGKVGPALLVVHEQKQHKADLSFYRTTSLI